MKWKNVNKNIKHMKWREKNYNEDDTKYSKSKLHLY
jgi:hypothetical protein